MRLTWTMRSAVGVFWGMVLCLVTSAGVARAQGFTVQISPPLGESLGAPLYTESAGEGPFASSLVQGDSSLLTPLLHSGVSDPLGYLLETGLMSPYVSGLVASSPYAGVQALTLTDSTVASRFSGGGSFGGLPGGAGASNGLSTRAAFSGLMASGASGRSQGGGASSSFGGLSAMHSFAAGRGGGMGPGASSAAFVDPNALLALAASSPGMGMQAGSGMDAAAAAGMESGGMAGGPETLGVTVAPMGSSPNGQMIDISGVPSDQFSSMVSSAGALPSGPSPGSAFPIINVGMSSGYGFRDSTMGTAGLPPQFMPPVTSPLVSNVGAAGERPFSDLSSANSSNFLHPSLESIGSSLRTTRRASAGSLHEYVRKQRMRAMIDGGGAALPSPFEQRRSVREYLNHSRLGSHRPVRGGAFPSATPQPVH